MHVKHELRDTSSGIREEDQTCPEHGKPGAQAVRMKKIRYQTGKNGEKRRAGAVLEQSKILASQEHLETNESDVRCQKSDVIMHVPSGIGFTIGRAPRRIRQGGFAKGWIESLPLQLTSTTPVLADDVLKLVHCSLSHLRLRYRVLVNASQHSRLTSHSLIWYDGVELILTPHDAWSTPYLRV